MTGFGTASASWSRDDGEATVDVELRSVNARFFELKVRQPFGAGVEQALRKRLGGRLGRGRVELSIGVRRDAGTDAAAPTDALAVFGLEPAQVDRAVAAVAAVGERAHATLELSPINAAELLRLLLSSSKSFGTGDRPSTPPDFLDEIVDRAVEILVEFREREGQALAEALGRLADELEAQVAALVATLPAEADRLGARLRQRIADLTARLAGDGGVPTLDADRLAQEVALVVARGDVTEELDRIGSHLSQLREVLASDARKGQGKTLEFVAQELFREITTIGSKITSHEGSRIVIEAKGTIERIREQVHNVE